MVGYAPITWSGNASLIRSPPEQAPLSSRNAYTTWPGGVDPTVPLYNTDNQKFGGGASARRRRRNTRKSRRASRKSRRATRKSRRNNLKRKMNRKGRRASRKSRRASRRRHRGGYQTCSPIDTLGSRASIPMTASVCPEGYFQDKGLIA